MSLKTVSGVLAAAVADGATFAVNYPTGFTRGDFIPGVDHRLVVNQVELKAPNKITLSFGASSVTITNKTGAAFPVGAAFVFQFEVPGNDSGQLANDGKTRMSKVMPWPMRYVNLGSPIATNDAGLRAAAAIGGAGALALLATSFDVPRNVIITSSADATNVTFTISSKDVYGNAVVENVVGVNNGVAAGKKAHSGNIVISASGAPNAGTIKIGWGNVLGLPVYLPNAVHILKEMQDGALATAGTTVAGDQSFPSATTGDVRGTYVPNSAPDGTKAYGLLCALPDPGYLGADQYAG